MKTAIVESVRVLLEAVVDYAGLFPPAQLDMANTVRNYARYLKSNESWMLGRLIVPVARLAEFEREAATLLPRGDDPDAEPWQISALTAAASDVAQFTTDLAAIDAFNVRHDEGDQGIAIIDTIELKAASAAEIEAVLDRIPDDLFPYVELPLDGDPRGLIAALADADAGAKVRTGGTMAAAYPSPKALATFIVACAAADVPFKATAGMHHPLRHFSDAVNTHEFGFLNVFVAGCLAQVHDVDVATVQQVLEESSFAQFSFGDDHVAWRHLRMAVDQIEAARTSFAASFGSCSFDEPTQGLRELGLLS